MRNLAFATVMILGAATAGAEDLPFRFDTRIEMPASPLLNTPARNSQPMPVDISSLPQDGNRRIADVSRRTSNMPVVAPTPGTDYKLRTVAPDESVEHKLIVKVPQIDSSR